MATFAALSAVSLLIEQLQLVLIADTCSFRSLTWYACACAHIVAIIVDSTGSHESAVAFVTKFGLHAGSYERQVVERQAGSPEGCIASLAEQAGFAVIVGLVISSCKDALSAAS